MDDSSLTLLAPHASLPSAAEHCGRARRVLLICPPFQNLTASSHSTALLASYLREHQVECEEAYLHFELAALLGLERYQGITDGVDGLVGEMLFAEGLHGELEDRKAELRLTELVGPKEERGRIRSVLVQRCLARLDEAAPDLVGMTTSLNQLLAALFYAKAIKEHAPHVKIVLGGSSCSDPMGRTLLAAYPQLDYVVSGWGEEALCSLAKGEEPVSRFIVRDAPIELETSPVVDYRAYVRDAKQYFDLSKLALAFESSRGCWWGSLHHCTFCGLNGAQRAFVAKSSERVVREIGELWSTYKMNLCATDAILATAHLREVMPKLAEMSDGPHLIYEVKANLKEADVATLKRARVAMIQPGIESLCTVLLKRMNKGVSAIQNLALLKWCREQGMAVAWNQLVGIPGETPVEYAEQIALMKKIPHLPPPLRMNPIRIDRFSPYFNAYRDYGWKEIEPLGEYRSLHPTLSPEALSALAYHFRGLGLEEVDSCFREAFDAAVSEWQRRHQRGDGLFLHPTYGLIRNEDGTTHRYDTHAGLRKLLELTHQPNERARIIEESGCAPVAIEQMVQAGVLYAEGERILNLAVRLPG